MSMILNLLLALVILIAGAMITVTLSLNTKSDGLGAAITGASDSYRGAVGVEEQKRNLLRMLCFIFLGVSLVYGILVGFKI